MEAKTEIINIRLKPSLKRRFERAAKIREQSRSEFLLEAASEAASNVLSDRRQHIVNDEEFIEIMKIAEAPINRAALAMLGASPPWEE